MAAYESVIIVNPTLDDDQAQAIFDDIQRRFTEEIGVEMLVVDHWGRRKLAYEIERKTEGNYMFYRFTRDNLASKADFSDLERFMRFSENIMRFMITRISEEQAKAPVLRPEIFSYMARPARGGGRPDRPGASEARPAEGAEAAAGGEGDAAKPAEASETAAAETPAAETPAAEAPAAEAPAAEAPVAEAPAAEGEKKA